MLLYTAQCDITHESNIISLSRVIG